MPDEPYRYAQAPQDDELARIAREGQSRIDAARKDTSNHANEADWYNLRVAIGAVRGSPIKRVFFVGILLGLATLAAGIVLTTTVDSSYGALIFIGFWSAFAFFMVFIFLAPRATRGQVEAERQWVASLPFPLEGYFEALSKKPDVYVTVAIAIEFQNGGPDAPTLRGVFGILDAEASVEDWHPERARIKSGKISGSTGIRVNRVPVYRNHRLAKYLRRLVEVVLKPLHRSRPIRHVRIFHMG